MTDLVHSLNDLKSRFDAVAARLQDSKVHSSLSSLEDGIKRADEAFSGSWIGYHSCVYYKNLEPRPPGAHFSPEWGLTRLGAFQGTSGEWEEYSRKELYEYLKDQTSGPSLDELFDLVNSTSQELQDLREELVSTLSAIVEASGDAYLEGLLHKAQKVRTLSVKDAVKELAPQGSFFSRDSLAMSNGMQTPPHMQLLAEVRTVRQRIEITKSLGRVCWQASSHLERRRLARREGAAHGSKVFIGHGRSRAWKDLKDFLQDRMGLEWDEFNRVPIAGVTNIARLSELLGDAKIAFLVMTAEDEQKDGTLHARMNVIHEAGLFQGKLGFTKAIILLEDGCEEFSNIQGLGQIRFPAGNISAVFEDIRLVLEREGVIDDRN